MSLPEKLRRAAHLAKTVILIAKCYLKIRFYSVAKHVILWSWEFFTSFTKYGRQHINELLYQVIVAIIGGVIAGYILHS